VSFRSVRGVLALAALTLGASAGSCDRSRSRASIEKTSEEKSAGVDTASYTSSPPPFGAVPGRYVVTLHSGGDTNQVVGETAERLHFVPRRIWTAIASFSADLTNAQLTQLLDDPRVVDVPDDCE
jgi:hypothetical protein